MPIGFAIAIAVNGMWLFVERRCVLVSFALVVAFGKRRAGRKDHGSLKLSSLFLQVTCESYDSIGSYYYSE